MAAPPASTKTSLQQRLSARARERWPELAGIDVKFRGEFAYVTGRLKDGDTQPLMRLRYGGSAARWGFAVYLASLDGYEVSAPTHRRPGRHTRRRPGHRIRPLPRRPHRLDPNPRRTYERAHLASNNSQPFRPRPWASFSHERVRTQRGRTTKSVAPQQLTLRLFQEQVTNGRARLPAGWPDVIQGLIGLCVDVGPQDRAGLLES